MALPLSFVPHKDSADRGLGAVLRIMLLVLLAIGWAAPASGTPDRTSDRFEQLRQRDLRVASVAYRLSIANQALCRDMLVPQLGFVLHGIAQYDPADRAEVARSLGLGDEMGVMAVVAGSPAAAAGLAPGDRIASINGLALTSGTAAPVPTRAPVDHVQALLIAAMAKGPVTLGLATPLGERRIIFAAENGCPSNVELMAGGAVNAWADGARVMVSGGLLDHCDTDDNLALVIGHEMAHNLLHHRKRLSAQGIAASGLLPATEAGSREMRETEEEADRFAVGMAMAAGYDLASAEAFLGRLLTSVTPVAATHPDPERRLVLLRAAIAAHGSN